ncbi:MAG: hypothetical protein GY801_38535, partial [bacterium]|nr:hypothetical protein [bacterium]
QLRMHAWREPKRFLALTQNLPEDFYFADYDSVWKYKTIPTEKRELEIDIFAKASEEDYSLIGEVKNRDTKKFTRDEAERFLQKAKQLIKRENLAKAVPFVFSLTGFTEDALTYFQDHAIAWSGDKRWLGEAENDKDS